ncbi:MAG: DUF2116 family Zn-ribbon domain-containing protein [Proteobacteria bacterium]|nr:DUF2116 family Zn-ribbon domain-containing protein [Pseudomonadota bacterium]
MDISDKATEREEQDRDIALHQRKPEGPAATGQCLYCEDPLPPGKRWCCTACRDDWEFIQK